MLATLMGVGHEVKGMGSVEEALQAYDLDWEVETRPSLFHKADGTLAQTGGFVVVRPDTEAVLGRVGADYTPLRNSSALQHVDRLIETGVASLEGVFELKGGKKVGASLKVNEDITVGGEDPHSLYLTLLTSHDGTTATSTLLTPIRLWCTNQLALSFKEAKMSWGVRHISSIEEDLKQVASELEFITTYRETFEEIGGRLMLKRMSETEVKMITEAAMAFVTNEHSKKAAVDGVMETYMTSPLIGDTYRGTGWGALNAVTEWIDHKRTYRGAEARYHYITSGVGARIRNNALQALVAA